MSVAVLLSWLRARRAVVAAGCVALALVLVVTGVALTALPGASPSPTTRPTPRPTPTLAPTFDLSRIGTFTPDAAPDYSDVAATTDGELLGWYDATIATRHPIAVMIDDQAGARPQSGLSQANIVYQAPAEGGIPRYMAIFQTRLPNAIGPIRSSRMYYVAWAEEWRAMYVHMLGAPNALGRLAQIDGKYVYNADGLRWGRKYMSRVTYRVGPHNLYSTGANLLALAKVLGATAPFTSCPFAFTDPLPLSERPDGGTIVIPYHGNTINYKYDSLSNTYLRGVSGQAEQTDYGNGQRIAPSNVVVLYQVTGLLPVAVGQANKHRLEVQYLGTGKAMVFTNGQIIEARWTKKNESSPTYLTYATGAMAGQSVELVRGQIFIQVVPTDLAVKWTAGVIPTVPVIPSTGAQSGAAASPGGGSSPAVSSSPAA